MPRDLVLDYYSRSDQMNSISDPKVSAFMWGKPGTGKTHFIGTFPKPYVLDTDGGLLTLIGKDAIGFTTEMDMNVYETFINIIQDAKMKQGPFAPGGGLEDRETIAIDSFSQLSAILFEQIMEENPKDTRAAYGFLLKRMTTLTSLFKELKLYGYHIVGTAGESNKENSLTGQMEPVPNIAGSFRDFIAHLFDLSLWTEVVTRNGVPKYYAYSLSERQHAAKERFGLPYKNENLTFDDVMEALNARLTRSGGN